MCRLSCTATLILSINNNPPHCRRGPHLLITICHLSDAPPPLAPPHPPPPPSLSPRHPKLCSPPLHPSQQGQLSSSPPSPHRLTPSPLAFSRETWSSIQRAALSLSPCLALTYFNCTGEGVEFIKRKGGVGGGAPGDFNWRGRKKKTEHFALQSVWKTPKMRIYYYALE